MRGRLAVLAVVAVGVAAPAEARAADHVWLSVHTVGPVKGFSLTASVTSPDFDPVTGDEILGVTLARRLSPLARESHALRLHHRSSTVSFDGQRGRWRTAGVGGQTLSLDMALTATGEAQPVAAGDSLPFACRGAFVRRPVIAHGPFAVRTGTGAVGTIRLIHLTGWVTYNSGGPVRCGLNAGSCESAISLAAGTGSRSLVADPQRRTLVLTFREAGGWYHVMELSRLTVPAAEPPTIRIRLPATGPATGSLTFAARDTKEGVDGQCRVVTTQGDLAGKLRVRFTGWGARTFAATSATYRRSGP
jgi:hypothetical protein